MTYDVLLVRTDKSVIARVRQWPQIVVEGETEEKALAQVQANLRALLQSGRMVQLDLDVDPEHHPWVQFAGMFVDDTDWDEFQAELIRYRQEIDRLYLKLKQSLSPMSEDERRASVKRVVHLAYSQPALDRSATTPDAGHCRACGRQRFLHRRAVSIPAWSLLSQASPVDSPMGMDAKLCILEPLGILVLV